MTQNNLHYADDRVKRSLSDLQTGVLHNAQMEMHERLKLARERRYKTAKEAAEALGVPYGTYSGHEAGTRGFDQEAAARYAAFFRVSAGWLSHGDGEMEPKRASFVSSFDPDAPGRQAFGLEDDHPQAHPDRGDAARRAARRQLEPGEIIERDVLGGMGPGGRAEVINVDGQEVDDVAATWRVPTSFLHSELRAREADVDILRVDGDSMIPTLYPGDRVIVHRAAQSPVPDGVFAIDDGIGISIKRLQIVRGSDPLQIRVISDNPVHPVDTIQLSDLQIVGRVIFKFSRL